MDTKAATGIPTAILLISFILVGATAASVIIGNTENSQEFDYNKILKDTIHEISTYIKVDDVIGKYSSTSENQYINKIAILIKPLYSTNIDISNVLIKINNGEKIRILSNNNYAELIKNYSIFEHPLWNMIKENEYSVISILDKDRSINNHNIINDNTDTSYLIVKLPKDLTIKKGETIEITLILPAGTSKTIYLEAPLPIQPIVSLN